MAFLYLQKLGFKPLLRNCRLFYAEIDGVLLSPEGDLILLEVKTGHFDPSWRPVVSERQKKRIGGVLKTLAECAFGPVRTHLIVVAGAGESAQFHFYPDFLS